MFDALWQDLRFALRRFRRAPAMGLGAMCTLAVAIGAAVAVFSVADAVITT